MEYTRITKHESDYELIDSGSGRKLERFGNVILDRPDPQILWSKQKPELWKNAVAKFDGQWHGRKNIPVDWQATIGNVSFLVKLSAFKHVGIFPEHVSNWEYIRTKIREADRPIAVLNLFGYTGGATVAALQAGASVCHVDGSKSSILWAKQNAQASLVSDKPVRWILDDALSFVRREIRRKNVYDMIIMDPPASGRGPKGEEWKIGDDLHTLIELTQSLLSKNPLGVLLNGYSAGYSHHSYNQLLQGFLREHGGEVTSGELVIEELDTKRVLPAGIYGQWVR